MNIMHSYIRTLILLFFMIGSIVTSAFAFLGNSPLPSNLNPSDVILFEDFESSKTLFDAELAKSESSVTSSTAFRGNHSLKMQNAEFGKFSSRLSLGGAWDELYARYMFRIDNPESACWNSSQHYKNMGFEGGSSNCKGGNYTSDGTDCFTVRTRFNYPFLGVHVESEPYPGLFTALNPVDVADGQWHCLEVGVKLNTPGSSDGVIRNWVDGHQQVRENLEFRTAETLQIEKWWFTYWSNDNWCAPLYIDELVISKTRIHCPDAAPIDALSPMAPGNLRLGLGGQ